MNRFIFILACCALGAGLVRADSKLTAQQIEFFEKNIQPILTEACYKCHSHGAEKIRGALVLDTREGLLKGGENGPAIIPGDPDNSLLIQAVRYTDSDLKMPPKNQKLSDAQIALLEEWVRMGAPDPREGKAYATVDMDAARKHCALPPVREPALPKVKSKSWVKSPVDAFILAKLEENKMKPSAAADKQTLIRRVTYDLIGLPPTPEEVDAFLKDKSSDAFAKVVDRLMDSPHYGERWARHWLDVARYADTKGDQGNRGAETRFIYSFTYRDYVINSFNQDKPFDEFIIEQIAADLLPMGDDKSALAALGFLTVGNRFRNAVNEVIDDRIDVVTRGLMGLTVSCARCHDHKFDPVPTADYYSLHGIFASTLEPEDLPLLEPIRETPEYLDFQRRLADAEQSLGEAQEENRKEIVSIVRRKVGDYLSAVHDYNRGETNVSRNVFMSRRELDNALSLNWERLLKRVKESHNPVLSPWVALSELPDAAFSEQSAQVVQSLQGDAARPVNRLVLETLSNPPLADINDAAKRLGKLFKELDKKLSDAKKEQQIAQKDAGSDTATGLPPDWAELEEAIAAKGAPLDLDAREIRRLTSQQTDRKLNVLIRKVNDVKLRHPGSPKRALAVEDIRSPRDSYVFIRGNAATRGPRATTQFLETLSTAQRKPFKNGSGRLQVAQAIASRDNPLTARVIVNRIWMHHFGEGIVPTPSDFGLRSEPPSHPDLLDYLAAKFMDNNWSLKKLHRLIVLSNVYQQNSHDKPAYSKLDPGNRLLWRMNRRRLDFESMRDTFLAVSGTLDRQIGGQSVELMREPYSSRRTVYGWLDRMELPDVMLNFDFANPDMSSPLRYTTTVPQQALFLMNSPFVVEQARILVRRPELANLTTGEQKVRQLYRILFQRDPDRAELKTGLEFIKKSLQPTEPVRPSSAWRYGFGKIDPATSALEHFFPLEFFSANAWRMRLGNDAKPLLVTASGGLTDDKLSRGVIRRWTAPCNGVVSVDGALGHAAAKGAGVNGYLLLNQKNLLGEWEAKHSKASTRVARIELRAGDTLDFVVKNAGVSTGEIFSWSPVISLVVPNPNETPGLVPEWNAEADFAGPADPAKKEPLNAWEKYAQVLLLTNETVFVN